MSIKKISQKEAYKNETDAVKGWYYQLPDVDDGRSVIYAEVTGDHGQRKVGDKPRIYYIIAGKGEFIINEEFTMGMPGDVIVIPPHATYSYRATESILKVLMVMDLIDLTKLRKNK
ncbi:hypothetical protein A3F32_01250 [Candidatus Roizmanbacteria bacterium RIFCSPHIGHO2_12_FULL_42_10]|uniref:Cupin 2 conserved barrel domain-containing protein n=3 Tax=Candidatus Roizmaniibacteriota TaxID=1752723 RepID=A0A1F7GFS7_9BACT|nr:MAG: hypothetical protein A2866_02140 [Candidatus Roizmanbacteria bacterium RIFCSPHIGHO2_01_FULL_39_8]OGK25801.1 MAG: hypothetical protein A3C28_00750 [Candidatus Roizmanbacteria bacterium RIFCSPHIGHO2_02_FULL_39_9]OGK38284.1 MAG: hypothetical protein A3F32_01250 [Candidatus Roizmanbacteria bacterium RIFCSPHIGHO2_12_FULL_42_10]